MDWITKSEAETDPSYGHLPSQRPIQEYLANGIVNVDKVSGPTSRQVADWVKNILGTTRAGHSGTLDPKVTGVFVVALDNATKAIPTLLPSPKEYVCLMHLHENATPSELKKAFKEFQGKIYQRPPLRSAVKRLLRVREIYSLDLIEKSEKDVLFKVTCEAGFYVRKLCHDIGIVLGTGAQMTELRRTKTASFDESSIVTLQELSEAKYLFDTEGDDSYLRKLIIPVESTVKNIPKIVVHDSAVAALCNGSKLMAPGVIKLQKFKKGDKIVLLTLKGELISLAVAEEDSSRILKMQKGICAKSTRVILPEGIYPRKWKSKVEK
ncbi:RNA-guided pseudouridylation complex pseudouridine synthase subunit Cbf5 [Candidatus Undinarchaeota archaeon]